MKWLRRLTTLVMCTAFIVSTGCHNHRTTRKITIDGPEKKSEIKIETSRTEKH